jgi:hypothetical protein
MSGGMQEVHISDLERDVREGKLHHLAALAGGLRVVLERVSQGDQRQVTIVANRPINP